MKVKRYKVYFHWTITKGKKWAFVIAKTKKDVRSELNLRLGSMVITSIEEWDILEIEDNIWLPHIEKVEWVKEVII